MTHDDTIRANIKAILRAAMREHSISYSDLMSATSLHLDRITHAVDYGIAETVDLINICRPLDLDASAVLAEAYSHAHADLPVDTFWEDLDPHEPIPVKVVRKPEQRHA